MYRVFAMSDIENKPVAQMRIPARENPSSEIVCLVDDDPMVLRSTGFLLASDGFDVCRFDNGEDFIAYVASHDVPALGHAPKSSSRKPSLWRAFRNACRRAASPRSGMGLKSTIQPDRKR